MKNSLIFCLIFFLIFGLYCNKDEPTDPDINDDTISIPNEDNNIFVKIKKSDILNENDIIIRSTFTEKSLLINIESSSIQLTDSAEISIHYENELVYDFQSNEKINLIQGNYNHFIINPDLIEYYFNNL